jgi:hypothetical protein
MVEARITRVTNLVNQTHEMDRFYRKQHNDIRFI